MSEMIIVQNDQGKTFEVCQGDPIMIRLEENPTTGYRWEIASVNQQIVEIVESNYEIASGGGIGGGGTRLFQLRAKSPGTTNFELNLRRSWEPENHVIDRFSVNIQVL